MSVDLWLPMLALVAIIGLGSVICNLLILAQVQKLYTEYFKDRSASRRREA